MPTPTFQPASNLRSRTFLGLLAAQFLAAFNDQAIHASAMFFAINQQALTEAQAISLMPILFYAPWAIFCTLAGYLADRYGKRTSLVFWKMAEVVITLVALGGFWLGSVRHDTVGPWIVLSTVFLMGMHSAFFVPAKYGAMPEILQPHLLSRGNGILESLSFLAVILGTVFGGVLSTVFRGQETVIGVILALLALVGAAASLFIERIPPANPTRPFPPYIYKPLWDNLKAVMKSRPLAFAVVGIAFFTFLVAFMRATVYMHGESQVPQWSEAKTSYIVGMVALGIGLGSPLVGYLSGGKVEVGLVPVGALGMVVATSVAAFSLSWLPGLVVCIAFIGFFTGFYLVPLFTLLQHRAPKTSKGDIVATSNFVNVTGAILASLLFFVVVGIAHKFGLSPEVPQQDVRTGTLTEEPVYEHGQPVRFVIDDVAVTAGGTTLIDSLGQFPPHQGDVVTESVHRIGRYTYHALRPEGTTRPPEYDDQRLPALLFLGAGATTLFTLLLLWWQLPDLFLRTLAWCRARGRYRLRVVGMNHLPTSGPVLLVTNAAGADACLQVVSATDRATRFVLVERAGDEPLPGWLRRSARRHALALIGADGVGRVDWDAVRRQAEAKLGRGEVVALALDDGETRVPVEKLLAELAGKGDVPVLPVHVELGHSASPRPLAVFGGELLVPGTPADEVQAALQRLAGEWQQVRHRDQEPVAAH